MLVGIVAYLAEEKFARVAHGEPPAQMFMDGIRAVTAELVRVGHAIGVGLEASDVFQSRLAAAIESASGQYDLGIQRFGDCGNIRARDVVPH